MSYAVSIGFFAPIPVGHRIQVIRSQTWTSPLFGGHASWHAVEDPVLVDLDTGVVYCEPGIYDDLVPSPLGFKPNTGRQIASVAEGRVTSCIVTSRGGEHATLRTALTIEFLPTGYRG